MGLAALGGFLSAFAYFRWRAHEIAMRHGQSLAVLVCVLLVCASAALSLDAAHT